eukprot:CAMPEP_0196824630 /NCGR_PEP_ID=MMETSP1362-20130617/92593_1 /TAXON_ID=163516 /ORGANISM="Leptocylindrus danicus, Strain CCMP1856" /LENGTH=313 /DNA_ID=CAMNT_0042204949 /DNA_START=240 /DNA_END=1181 /DNA_ORIENTATION=-
MADVALTVIGSFILLRDSFVIASYHLACLVEDSNVTIDDVLSSYLTPMLQGMCGVCTLYAIPTTSSSTVTTPLNDAAADRQRNESVINVNAIRRQIIRSACGEWWERVMFEPGGVSLWVEDILGQKIMKDHQANPVLRDKDALSHTSEYSTSDDCDYDRAEKEDDAMQVGSCVIDDGTQLSLSDTVHQAVAELIHQNTNWNAKTLSYVRMGSVAALLLQLCYSRRARNIVVHLLHSSILVTGVCGCLGATGLIKLMTFEELPSSTQHRSQRGGRNASKNSLVTVTSNNIARGVSAMMMLFVLMRIKRLLLHHK